MAKINGTFVEVSTTAMVSPAARREWLAMRPRSHVEFWPEGNGYRMSAFESEIDMARAMGRGNHAGRGKAPHPYDTRDIWQGFPPGKAS